MGKEILAAVQKAGIVGAGGGGFPTYAKLTKPADTVIINGAECEPLLQVDQQLIELYPQRIVQGLKAAMDAVGATSGIVALKAKYKEAVTALTKVVEGEKKVKIRLLDDFYPVGDEHVLVYEITGKIVPEGGIPLQVGSVVLNVETSFNIANALQGIPLTSKFVSVLGAVKTPLTINVPLGTNFMDLIDLAGGSNQQHFRLLEGGPMMGKEAALNSPVTKTTKGLIVLPREHPLFLLRKPVISKEIKRSMSICCQCMICSDLCPRNLLGHSLKPHLVIRAFWQGCRISDDVLTQAFLCSSCGICEVVCPAGIMPRVIFDQIKQELIMDGYKNPHHREGLKSHMLRELRKYPMEKLVLRMGLKRYYCKAPLLQSELKNNTPKRVELPLKQHTGVSASIVVDNGQMVKEGQLIATVKDGAIGAPIHASISGTIQCYKDRMVIKRVGT